MTIAHTLKKIDRAITGADLPAAIELLQAIPEPARRSDPQITCLEARTYLAAGRPGQAKQLLTPIIQRKADDNTIRLYLACCGSQLDASIIEAKLGADFAQFWKSSRTIRANLLPVSFTSEQANFARSSLWDLGAEPIDTVAMGQMAAVPKIVRRNFADRRC